MTKRILLTIAATGVGATGVGATALTAAGPWTATAAGPLTAASPIAAPAPPASPLQADTLAHVVPSPPAAVYEVTSSGQVNVDTPMGAMQVTSDGSYTLDLAFESADGGVRVTGTVTSFEASISNPMMGTQSAGLDVVSGSLDLVLSRRGESDVASIPEVSGPASQFSPFNSVANEFFPRLPDGMVAAGDTWVDTVTWSTDQESMQSTTTNVYTYTLVGDTVVDGRTLLNIGVTAEMATEADIEQGGMAISQSLAGTVTGSLLWDAERGLMTRRDIESEIEGTTSMAGMPPANMSITGTESVRLAN